MATASKSATTWNVTGQQQTTQAGQGGTFARGWIIMYQTGNGHQGSVFVTNEQYANVDLVRSMVANAAAQSDMIGSLSSEG